MKNIYEVRFDGGQNVIVEIETGKEFGRGLDVLAAIEQCKRLNAGQAIAFGGRVWDLPPRGRFGCQIRYTLDAILSAGQGGVALYAAMALRGRAREYAGRYESAFIRFARANADKLVEGAVGPRGGYGFRMREV